MEEPRPRGSGEVRRGTCGLPGHFAAPGNPVWNVALAGSTNPLGCRLARQAALRLPAGA